MDDITGKVCCFTGFRPHRFAFTPDGLRPEHVRGALAGQIGLLCGEGYRTFVTGMCIGVDMWAADAVLDLRTQYPDIRLIAVIPFEGQDSRWTIAEQREYQRILREADQVVTLFNARQAKEKGTDCYRLRNMWMVDRADTVLAVYAPEKAANNRTGTAATVHYARRKLRRIIYIHPETLKITEETVHQLAFPL